MDGFIAIGGRFRLEVELQGEDRSRTRTRRKSQAGRVRRALTGVAVGVGEEPAVASRIGLGGGHGLIIGTVVLEVGLGSTGPSPLDGTASGIGDRSERIAFTTSSTRVNRWSLRVCYGDGEGGCRSVSIEVARGVGHERAADGEGVPGVGAAREGVKYTVVGGCWCGPGHGSRAVSSIVTRADVSGHTADDGRL